MILQNPTILYRLVVIYHSILDLMNKLTLKDDITGLAKTIYDFVVDNEYDEFTSNYEMKYDILDKSFYKNFIENKKEEFLGEFKKINFYDSSIFNCIDNCAINNDIKNTQKILRNFTLAIFDVFKSDGVLPEVILSKTHPSPPLTFKRGNNKLDIKPTGGDYGLLFR